MKKLFISGWFLLAAAVLGSVFTGTYNPVALLVFSLIALALFQALALWSVVVQTRALKTE